jgi:hypothetical protein
MKRATDSAASGGRCAAAALRADFGRHPVACAARLALCAGLLVAAPCWAAGWSTFPIDDSLSQVQAPAAQLRWRHALPARGESNLLDATTDVRIVLNTTPWVGRLARIYMRMPVLPQSTLTVQWTTGGVLQAGRLAGGQRQLVFQGVVPAARMEDTMRVMITSDARDAGTPERVNFGFEIEVQN